MNWWKIRYHTYYRWYPRCCAFYTFCSKEWWQHLWYSHSYVYNWYITSQLKRELKDQSVTKILTGMDNPYRGTNELSKDYLKSLSSFRVGEESCHKD